MTPKVYCSRPSRRQPYKDKLYKGCKVFLHNQTHRSALKEPRQTFKRVLQVNQEEGLLPRKFPHSCVDKRRL